MGDKHRYVKSAMHEARMQVFLWRRRIAWRWKAVAETVFEWIWP